MEKSTATYAGFGQGYAHRPGKRPRGAGPLVLPDGGAEYTWSRAGPSSSSVSDFHDSGASSEDARLLDDHAHALDGSGDDDYGPDDGLVGQPRPSGVSNKRPRRQPSAADANSLPLEGTSELLHKLSAQAADDDETSMPHACTRRTPLTRRQCRTRRTTSNCLDTSRRRWMTRNAPLTWQTTTLPSES